MCVQELVVKVELPGLKGVADVLVDTAPNFLKLHVPNYYRSLIRLPCLVRLTHSGLGRLDWATTPSLLSFSLAHTNCLPPLQPAPFNCTLDPWLHPLQPTPSPCSSVCTYCSTVCTSFAAFFSVCASTVLLSSSGYALLPSLALLSVPLLPSHPFLSVCVSLSSRSMPFFPSIASMWQVFSTFSRLGWDLTELSYRTEFVLLDGTCPVGRNLSCWTELVLLEGICPIGRNLSFLRIYVYLIIWIRRFHR